MKKSFVLYIDQYEPVKGLSDAQKGQLFDAIFSHHSGETVVIDDPMVTMAFSFFKQTFDRDEKKYIARCQKNKENIEKRWGKKDDTNGINGKRSNNVVSDCIPRDTNHTDSDSDKIVTVISDSEIKETTLFDPPEPNEKDANKEIAKEVITEINNLGGKKFRFGKNNTENITARLNEKFTREDCLHVVRTKIKDPHFINNPKYYNPETLFRPSNFEKYLNESATDYNQNPKAGVMKKNGFDKEYYQGEQSTPETSLF